MSTYSAKTGEIVPEWFLIDARGVALGRLASVIAKRLQGKHKPVYTPHVDTGDAFVVINTGLVGASGTKAETKVYYRHSGYPGGLKQTTLGDMRKADPVQLLTLAVRRMLPRSKLGRRMLSKLRVYPGPQHDQAAQQPKLLDITALI